MKYVFMLLFVLVSCGKDNLTIIKGPPGPPGESIEVCNLNSISIEESEEEFTFSSHHHKTDTLSVRTVMVEGQLVSIRLMITDHKNVLIMDETMEISDDN